jgi:hypothetical protein
MKFGVHNPSWVYGSDPSEAFEGVKAKAQWAENHGFVWFSVMDHLIQAYMADWIGRKWTFRRPVFALSVTTSVSARPPFEPLQRRPRWRETAVVPYADRSASRTERPRRRPVHL